jgi:Glycosyl hydrolase family 79 C-terminal beta domain
MTVTVGSAAVGPAVPAGFVGLATEYPDVEKEVGTNPLNPDVAFEQIARNLAPYGGLTLRIGGDSTDWAWWPVAGMPAPPWVRYVITPTWAAVTKKLADDLHAHVIVGINMEANSPKIASTEVNEIASRLGSSIPTTFELGNEPELYSKFPFYETKHGRPVLGRSKSYSFPDITTQWDQLANTLPHVKLAGPGYSALNALPDVSQFLGSARHLSLLTVHSYPLKATRCGGASPDESHLFQPTSLQQLAAEVSAWTTLARQHSVPLRIDEMNSITCGGTPGFSNTLGPALWALNILPLYAEAGAQGVNFQNRPYTAQNLIQTRHTHSGWQVQVQPEYYGLLAFAKLTPPGSRLLQVSQTPGGLFSWAVRTPHGQTTVVLTNVNSNAATVGVHGAGADGTASVQILRAASGGLRATGGITLGGQSISTRTGQLVGTPVTTTVHSSNDAYNVTVPGASAAIVTFTR